MSEKEKAEFKLISIPHPEGCLFMETSKILNSTLNLDELLDIILDLTTKAMEAEASSFLLLDKKTDELTFFVALKDKIKQKKTIPLKMGQGIIGWVAQNQTPVILDEVRKDPRFSSELDQHLGLEVRSLICIPLFRRDKLIGVVEAFNKKEGKKFDANDLAILKTLADQIAIAIDNSYLYIESKRKTLEKEMLLEIDKVLSSSLDLEEILELILESLKKVVHYNAGGIFLVNRQTKEIEQIKIIGFDPSIEADLKLKIGTGLTGWVAKTGEPVIVPDISKDSRYINARFETKSEMVAPMRIDEKIIGVFDLQSDQMNSYDENDLELLTAFASQAAVSVERARLYQEIIKKRELEEELKIARKIQESFFPQEKPKISGFDLAGMNIPSEQVGGDYYDFIKIIESQVGVAIADVSGKGIPASLIMASFRASLKAEIRNNYAIRIIFSKVNNLLFESIERENYVTAVYGVLDTKNKIFTFSNAGHNAPILRRTTGQFEYLTEGGFALGMFENSVYEEKPMVLNSGDILVFYTDGVTETKGSDEEEFGIERLQEVIEKNKNASAREIQEKIIQAVKSFATGKSQADDLTMIVVKTL
jgi:sigma-B regulation protein RsbU (phosphoserine phosphatase)